MIYYYLRMAAGILGLLFFYGMALVPLIVLRPQLEGDEFLMGMLVWAALGLSFFPALLSFILRHTWFFYGKGEPVVSDLLTALLLETNDYQGPVKVTKNRKGLLLTWNHQDADWRSAMGRQEIKGIYELQLRFDNHRKIVTMNDQFRKSTWDPTFTKLKVGWFSRPQLLCRINHDGDEGMTNLLHVRPDEFHFESRRLKSAVIQHVRANGWNVCFSLF